MANMQLNTADNSSLINGTLTVHYTRNAPGTALYKVRTICGQSTRRAYFEVHRAPREATCVKCLAKAEAMMSE